jgi:hypothetical protein
MVSRLNLLKGEASISLLLVQYALFAALLINTFMTIPVEEVNLVAKFVNQLFIQIKHTLKSLFSNVPTAARLSRKSVTASNSLFTPVLTNAAHSTFAI